MSEQEEIEEYAIAQVHQWWVREDLENLIPSIQDDKFREFEDTFVQKYLKMKISWNELCISIIEINRKYKANHKKI